MDYIDQDLDNYIGSNGWRYIQKWNKMAENKRLINWNWPAFMFGGFWLAYRKMYKYSLIYFIILFFKVTIVPLIGNDILHGLTRVMALCCIFGLGLFGDSLYLRFATDEVIKIRKSTADDEEFEKRCLKAGGTSWVSVIITFLLVWFANIVVYMLHNHYHVI